MINSSTARSRTTLLVSNLSNFSHHTAPIVAISKQHSMSWSLRSNGASKYMIWTVSGTLSFAGIMSEVPPFLTLWSMMRREICLNKFMAFTLYLSSRRFLIELNKIVSVSKDSNLPNLQLLLMRNRNKLSLRNSLNLWNNNNQNQWRDRNLSQWRDKNQH